MTGIVRFQREIIVAMAEVRCDQVLKVLGLLLCKPTGIQAHLNRMEAEIRLSKPYRSVTWGPSHSPIHDTPMYFPGFNQHTPALCGLKCRCLGLPPSAVLPPQGSFCLGCCPLCLHMEGSAILFPCLEAFSGTLWKHPCLPLLCLSPF